uniref:PR domain zinc finger protein 16 n=1 Tax=Cacopsylla melanoneura TaxID=428564 RepID=A0A8D8LUM9_9HEMI
MVCGKTFSRPSLLKKHLEKHNGPPSLKCEYCDRCFYHSYSYKRHLNTHNRPDPDVCQVCGNVYTNRDAFRRHLKKHVERGELAALPPPERELPKISKVQQLMSEGIDLDEILRSCEVEVVELGDMTTNKPRNDMILTRTDTSKWILNVHELNNTIHNESLQQTNGMFDNTPISPVNLIISHQFKAIVKNSAISSNDISKHSILFKLNISSIVETYDVFSESTKEENLLSSLDEILIPNYVEEIPEIKPDILSGDFFERCETLLDVVDVEEIDLTEDVCCVMSALHRNMGYVLRPLQIVPTATMTIY